MREKFYMKRKFKGSFPMEGVPGCLGIKTEYDPKSPICKRCRYEITCYAHIKLMLNKKEGFIKKND